MRFVVALFVVTATIMFAVPAAAGIMFKDAADAPCGEIDPATPCYAVVGVKVTACEARRSASQHCRECHLNVQPQPDGTETTWYVCRRRGVSRGCYCDMSNVSCKEQGACTYIW